LDAQQYWQTVPVRRGFVSIKPVFEMIGERGFIAGSYAAFMCSPSAKPIQPGDIDIFATSMQNAEDIAHEIGHRFMISASFNGLVWSLAQWSRNSLPIQVITPNPEWKVFPDDIINSFDMDVSRALLVDAASVLADRNVGLPNGKLLRIASPLRSMRRVLKYHRRGVDFSDQELIKLFLAWDRLSEERREEIVSSTVPVPEFHESMDDGTPYGWYSDDDYYEGE